MNNRQAPIVIFVKAVGMAFSLAMILPVFVIVPISLTPDRFLSLPRDGLSLRHYENLFTNPVWLESTRQSLVIAGCVTILATFLGTMGAIGLWRIRSAAADHIRNILLLPLIVPPVVSALAFYKTWAAYGLLDSYAGIIIAHTVLAVPYVMITVSASLAGFDVRLEQAARTLGADPAYTTWHVIIPNVKAGVVSGAILAFLTSWDEIVVALFISGQAITTLPKQIWSGIVDNIDPTVAAVGTLFIALTLIATLIRLFLLKRTAAPRTSTAW